MLLILRASMGDLLPCPITTIYYGF